MVNKMFPENQPAKLSPETQGGEFIDRYIHIRVSFADRLRLLFSGRAYVRHVLKVNTKVEFSDDSSFTVVPPAWIKNNQADY
jgi:hypothetical protein